MSSHTFILLVIMILAGAFGGIVHYFLEQRRNPEGNSILRSVVISIAASFLVPLFLSMISSDLLTRSANDDGALFVFAGFCLIAAISSTAFIRRLSQKVIQEVKELRAVLMDTRARVDLLLDLQTEIPTGRKTLAEAGVRPLEKEARAVLNTFSESRVPLRSIEGIERDAGLSEETTRRTLDLLVSLGLLTPWGEAGDTRWYVTPLGRGALLELRKKR